EVALVMKPAGQSQTEVSEDPSGALLKQFQTWAAKEHAPEQVKPVQPVQDAPAQLVQNSPAPTPPAQKHRSVRHVQNARAEIPPVQNTRAQSQPVPNAQAPSFLQSFGRQN